MMITNMEKYFLKPSIIVKILKIILIVLILAAIMAVKVKSSSNDHLKSSIYSLSNKSHWTTKKIKELYKLRNYEPIWHNAPNSEPNIRAENLITTFKNAKFEGLTPEQYLMPLSNDELKTNWIKREIALTKQALVYIRHVMSGRFNPKKYLKEYLRDIPTYDEVQILSELLNDDLSLASLQKLGPVSRGNLNLKSLLRKYLIMKEQQKGWGRIAGVKKSLKLGDKGDKVRRLKEILYLQGDYPDEIISDEFDEKTREAVISFQKRHFLDTDGKVGPNTLRLLNVSIDEKINKIIVAMERTRWFLSKSRNDKKCIQVNLPSYELTAFEGNKEALDMPIIVGRAVRKTPIFSTSVFSIRFNPTWYVPRSIIVKDKIKIFKKDPDYIRRNGYRLIATTGEQKGKYVDYKNIDWENMTADKFNYRLIQRPGKLNALGKVRFSVVDSKYNIYLHSTPDKELFAEPRRNFSSGCIRVRNPVQLAKFIFDDPATWTEDKIIQAMEGRKTRNVGLNENVPMHVTYITVSFDNDGNAYFSPDKYNYDKNVLRLINDQSKHY